MNDSLNEKLLYIFGNKHWEDGVHWSDVVHTILFDQYDKLSRSPMFKKMNTKDKEDLTQEKTMLRLIIDQDFNGNTFQLLKWLKNNTKRVRRVISVGTRLVKVRSSVVVSENQNTDDIEEDWKETNQYDWGTERRVVNSFAFPNQISLEVF